MAPTSTVSSFKGRSSHESNLFRLNWWYVFLGKMQVLDYILAMTKSTTTDKVRYMCYRLMPLGSSFCLQNRLRVFIRYGTSKRSLVSEKNQTSCQTNMSPYRSISNVTNNKHELWKPVRLIRFGKSQFPIRFNLFCASFCICCVLSTFFHVFSCHFYVLLSLLPVTTVWVLIKLEIQFL